MKPERRTYWLTKVNWLGLRRKIMQVKTALNFSPERGRRIALALGGTRLERVG